MTKEMVTKIAETVYKSTISGNLKWEKSNSIFNNDTRHQYHAFSSDGKTKFACDININSDLSDVIINKWDKLSIHNEDIVDGVVRCESSDNEYVKPLYQWLYDNHVKKTLPNKNQNVVYNLLVFDIIKSIDVSEYRDQKINSIIESDEPRKEEKSEEKKRNY